MLFKHQGKNRLAIELPHNWPGTSWGATFQQTRSIGSLFQMETVSCGYSIAEWQSHRQEGTHAMKCILLSITFQCHYLAAAGMSSSSRFSSRGWCPSLSLSEDWETNYMDHCAQNAVVLYEGPISSCSADVVVFTIGTAKCWSNM